MKKMYISERDVKQYGHQILPVLLFQKFPVLFLFHNIIVKVLCIIVYDLIDASEFLCLLLKSWGLGSIFLSLFFLFVFSTMATLDPSLTMVALLNTFVVPDEKVGALGGRNQNIGVSIYSRYEFFFFFLSKKK